MMCLVVKALMTFYASHAGLGGLRHMVMPNAIKELQR